MLTWMVLNRFSQNSETSYIYPTYLHTHTASIPIFSYLSSMCVCAQSLSPVDSLGPQGLKPAMILCPPDFSVKNIGVGCHFLLQGNLSDQGIESLSPELQAESLPWSHQRSPIYSATNQSSISMINYTSPTICTV